LLLVEKSSILGIALFCICRLKYIPLCELLLPPPFFLDSEFLLTRLFFFPLFLSRLFSRRSFSDVSQVSLFFSAGGSNTEASFEGFSEVLATVLVDFFFLFSGHPDLPRIPLSLPFHDLLPSGKPPHIFVLPDLCCMLFSLICLLEYVSLFSVTEPLFTKDCFMGGGRFFEHWSPVPQLFQSYDETTVSPRFFLTSVGETVQSFLGWK